MTGAADSVDGAISERLATAVDRRLRVGIGLTVVGIVALSVTTRLGFWQALGLSLFYLLLPSLAVAQLPLLQVREIERTAVYLGSAATILVIGALALGFGVVVGGFSGLGLTWIAPLQMAAWVVGVTAAGLAIIGAFWPAGRSGPRGASDLVLQLIPRTAQEKRLFMGLSLVAGVGEEIAYRGYAFTAVQLLTPFPWTAAALSSAAFGVLHAYQGTVGIVRTALIGLILAVPVVATGSLVPAIIAHTLIDLVAGLVLGPRLVARVES